MEESKRHSRRRTNSVSLEVDEGGQVCGRARQGTPGAAHQAGTVVTRTRKPPGKPALTRRLVVLAGVGLPKARGLIQFTVKVLTCWVEVRRPPAGVTRNISNW